MESGDVQLFIGGNVEGLLVVDIVCDGHAAVSVRLLEEGDETGKLLFAEDGVHGGQTEFVIGEESAQFVKTVHGTGCGLNDQFHRNGPLFLQLLQMRLCLRRFVVDDDDYLVRSVTSENLYQTVNHGCAVQADKRFGQCHSLLRKP